MKAKFYFEIDTGGRECSRFEPRWSNYGVITAMGDNLDELLDNAEVDIMDQDGGTLDMVPADQEWMQRLVVMAYGEAVGAK